MTEQHWPSRRELREASGRKARATNGDAAWTVARQDVREPGGGAVRGAREAASRAPSGLDRAATPAPEAPSAPAAATELGARTPSRRELSKLWTAERAGERAVGPVTDERGVTRRPVAEPITSTTIPKYGSVHVPLEDPPLPPAVPGIPARTSIIRGAGAAHRAPRAPADQAPAAPVVGPASGPIPVPELEPMSLPAPTITPALTPGPALTPEPAPAAAPMPAPAPVAAPMPAPAPVAAPTPEPVVVESAAPEQIFESEEPARPEWRSMRGEPAEAPLVNRAPVVAQMDFGATIEDDDGATYSLFGTIVRYMLLIIAFFVIGALLWMFMDGQFGGSANAGGFPARESTHTTLGAT